MFKFALIINPYAGIGGKVGLKGSDGEAIKQQAFERGAVQQAVSRARQALSLLVPYKSQCSFFTVSGDMGEMLLADLGFEFDVIHQAVEPSLASDTIHAASLMLARSVDLIIFAGGDGTARNIYQAVENKLPVLGIPAGVKIHSGVYAITPIAAGQVLAKIVQSQSLDLIEASVMDIDEVAFREGRVSARQYGEMLIPAEHEFMQATKMSAASLASKSDENEQALLDIAEFLMDEMDDDYHYLIGSGTSCAGLMNELGLENSLLGIDWIHQNQLVQSDLNEEQILRVLDKHPQRIKLIITVIGGQGHIVGRGNQQLSAKVLRAIGKQNTIVIASPSKLTSLNNKPLIVDSDDPLFNSEFAGTIPVITGYQRRVLYSLGLESSSILEK